MSMLPSESKDNTSREPMQKAKRRKLRKLAENNEEQTENIPPNELATSMISQLNNSDIGDKSNSDSSIPSTKLSMLEIEKVAKTPGEAEIALNEKSATPTTEEKESKSEQKPTQKEQAPDQNESESESVEGAVIHLGKNAIPTEEEEIEKLNRLRYIKRKCNSKLLGEIDEDALGQASFENMAQDEFLRNQKLDLGNESLKKKKTLESFLSTIGFTNDSQANGAAKIAAQIPSHNPITQLEQALPAMEEKKNANPVGAVPEKEERKNELKTTETIAVTASEIKGIEVKCSETLIPASLRESIGKVEEDEVEFVDFVKPDGIKDIKTIR